MSPMKNKLYSKLWILCLTKTLKSFVYQKTGTMKSITQARQIWGTNRILLWKLNNKWPKIVYWATRGQSMARHKLLLLFFLDVFKKCYFECLFSKWRYCYISYVVIKNNRESGLFFHAKNIFIHANPHCHHLLAC